MYPFIYVCSLFLKLNTKCMISSVLFSYKLNKSQSYSGKELFKQMLEYTFSLNPHICGMDSIRLAKLIVYTFDAGCGDK